METRGWDELVADARQREALSGARSVLLALCKDEICMEVEAAVHEYVNDPGLCSKYADEFPSASHLSGRFYVQRVSDLGRTGGRNRLIVSCACLGWELTGEEGEYLGLDVRLSTSVACDDLQVDAVDSYVL